MVDGDEPEVRVLGAHLALEYGAHLAGHVVHVQKDAQVGAGLLDLFLGLLGLLSLFGLFGRLSFLGFLGGFLGGFLLLGGFGSLRGGLGLGVVLHELDLGQAVAALVQRGLHRGLHGGLVVVDAHLELDDVAAGVAQVIAQVADLQVGGGAVAGLLRAGDHALDGVGDGFLHAHRGVHQLEADLQVGQAVRLDAGLVHVQHGLEFLGGLFGCLGGFFSGGLGGLLSGSLGGLLSGSLGGLLSGFSGFLSGLDSFLSGGLGGFLSGLGGFLGRLRGLGGLRGQFLLQRDGRGGGRGLGGLVVVARGLQYGDDVVDVVVFADGIAQYGAAGEVNAQVHANAHDLHDQRDGDDRARDAEEQARLSGKRLFHACPLLISACRHCGC